jgi:hypothetical protein
MTSGCAKEMLYNWKPGNVDSITQKSIPERKMQGTSIRGARYNNSGKAVKALDIIIQSRRVSLTVTHFGDIWPRTHAVTGPE